MKLVSFRTNDRSSFGLVTDNGCISDVGAVLSGSYRDLKAVIAANAYEEMNEVSPSAPELDFGEIELLPVVPNPGKILCVGLNYDMHRRETNRPDVRYPTLFSRYPESQIGHEKPLIIPKESECLDYEGELAVIIGRPGRSIPTSQAFAHVAGYACYNDGSVRDWQQHTSQWLPGKNFVGTGAFGPWMATKEECPDVEAQELRTLVNGVEMQRASISDMIFRIPDLIAYLSTFVPLAAGDVIVSGTPGGVGFKRNPPVYLREGDVVEVTISGVGNLRNPVVAELAHTGATALSAVGVDSR